MPDLELRKCACSKTRVLKKYTQSPPNKLRIEDTKPEGTGRVKIYGVVMVAKPEELNSLASILPNMNIRQLPELRIGRTTTNSLSA